jgi:hypothetical protein
VRPFFSYLGLVALFGIAAEGSIKLAALVPENVEIGIARGCLAAFTMLIGFALFMLKDVQGLDAGDALSKLGLGRLRRAQRIAWRRLMGMIALGIFGFLGASLTSFSEGNALEFVRTLGLLVALSSVTVLFVLSIVYVPRLFFDLQSARNALADIIQNNEARLNQLEALGKSDNKNGN